MKLFIPGPVDVRQEVLDAMRQPQMSHRSKDISLLQARIEENLQKLFFTKNTVLLSSSSGTGAMEMVLRSLTVKKAAVFSCGAFGDRFHEIALYNGIDADYYRFEDGKPIDMNVFEEALKKGVYDTITITHNETSTGVMNDLKALSRIYKKYPEVMVIVDTVSSFGGVKISVDDLQIDACVASTQKALGVPPGLAVMSVSDKAIKRFNEIGYRGFYLDLKRVYERHVKSHQYPSTPNTAVMHALDCQLHYIVHVEGIENRFKRHQELANYTRDWVEKHFDCFAEAGYRSDTITSVKNTKGLDLDKVKQALKEKGYVFSQGYGKHKQTAFRIPHMADRTLDELKAYLKEIESL